MAFQGLAVGEDTGGFGGLVIDGPAKAFHLSRGKDSFASRHVGTVVHNEDGRAQTGVDIGTCCDNRQIIDGVVINASEVDKMIDEGVDDAHVISNDAPIGSSIHEGFPLPSHGTGIVADGVEEGAIDGGRWRLVRLACHPAEMPLHCPAVIGRPRLVQG